MGEIHRPQDKGVDPAQWGPSYVSQGAIIEGPTGGRLVIERMGGCLGREDLVRISVQEPYDSRTSSVLIHKEALKEAGYIMEYRGAEPEPFPAPKPAPTTQAAMDAAPPAFTCPPLEPPTE